MIIVDTGYWLALANTRDRFHRSAKDAYSNLSEPLVTTWPIVTETCHLLLHRIGAFAELAFIKSLVQNAFIIHEIKKSDHERIKSLMNKYRDLPMDLADASAVLLAEHLGHGRILSTDQREFKTYRWKHHRPFENLLAEF